MSGWTRLEGMAVGLPLDNVDTDQLIPARFMSQPRSEGYGDFLLHDLRRGEAGPDPDFPLNRWPGGRVLVAGRNFGSGSSREAAVYALVDAGFRAVLAPSFGDIFAGNAVNNGLLPAAIGMEEADALQAALAQGPVEAVVDIAGRAARVGGHDIAFTLDETWATKLINGWDDIDLTLAHADAIHAYARDRRDDAPWVWP